MIAEEHDESEPGMVGEDHNIESSLQERSQAIVEAAADEVDTVDTVTAIERGPRPSNPRLRDENAIDLIVMGTHGRTGSNGISSVASPTQSFARPTCQRSLRVS